MAGRDRFHRHFEAIAVSNRGLAGMNYPYVSSYPYSYPSYYDYGHSGPGEQFLEMPLDYPDSPSASGSYSGRSFYPGQGADSPDSLRQVQSTLEREGYYSGPVDGVLGPQTREAIENYQRDHRLTVTGKVTSAMLNRMGF
jgi:hypothetical protein